MPINNLGRDKIASWTDNVWGDIDKAVLGEVGRLRVAQKVFTATANGSAQYVPADVFDPATMTIAEGLTKPFIEISAEFALTPAQLEDEANLHAARTLSRMAAKMVALAEDTLFFQGDTQIPGIKIVNGRSAGKGLLGTDQIKTVHVPQNGRPGKYGENTFDAVAAARGLLTKDQQPGPFALILEPAVYADTFDALPGTLVTPADRIKALVTAGFYESAALPPFVGLVISLGGEPTSLYVGQDAVTAYTQTGEDGTARFRVFERVQLVARDTRAFVRLDFAKSPARSSAGSSEDAATGVRAQGGPRGEFDKRPVGKDR